MGNLTSSLTVKLVDDVTKPAKSVAQALEDSEKKVKAVAKAMADSGATDRFSASLAKLKLSAKDIDSVSSAWKKYAETAKLAANASDWTKAQSSGVRRWESQTLSSLRAVQREQERFARASKKAMESGHGGLTGRQVAAGVVGGYVAHSTAHFARESLDTYREFDNARRYSKAVMNVSDEDQSPLVLQAIRGGGTTKYNDIQWLEAQRNLAARGLNVKQVLALTPIAATLGQAMDRPLEDSSSLLEGGMFGFGKDISTYDKALANAKRTADLQVKASKISGMDFDDVKAAYKFGAAPFRMAGLSEEQLLAFAAVGKKSNMGGDEMGVAARALAANLLKPTAGAKTAMLASGIDYSAYQKAGAPMKVDAFANDIAARYGVALSKKAKGALQHVFDDKALVGDAAKFMPAVMKLLGGVLGGSDAKSKAKIAGAAGRYRDASMAGVDAEGLFNALIPAIAKNPALANLIFGSKQGARIRAAIGDPDVYLHKLDDLKNHSDGYAQNVSDQRMAGFDGAVSRFEGAVKNLESALPRAFDNDGKGGILTSATDKIGKVVQAMAEAPPHLQRLGVEAGAVAGIFAGMKGAEALLGGFGLKGSAVALTEAAHALMGAAGKETVDGALGAAANAPGGKGKRGVWRLVGGVLKWVPFVGPAIDTGEEGLDYLHDKHVEEFGDTPPPDLTPHSEIRKHRQPMKRGENLIGPDPAGHLAEVKATADAAKSSIDGLNTTVAPVVNGASLDAALAKANALAATLRSLNGLASGVSSAVAGISVPSLGAAQRGNFSYGGNKGE